MAMAVRPRSMGGIPPCSSSMVLLSSAPVRMGFKFNTNSSANRIPFLKAIRSSQAQASASTVSLKRRRPQNVDGEFFVGKKLREQSRLRELVNALFSCTYERNFFF